MKLFLLRQTIGNFKIIAFGGTVDMAGQLDTTGAVNRAGHDAGGGAAERAPEHRAATAVTKATLGFVR